MTKSRGFSLIELMVVIAVVALLATIAVPAYKQYIIKAEFAKAQNYVQNVANQVKVYYASKGRVPTIAELGLPADGPTDTQSTNPNTWEEYLAPMVARVTVSSTALPRCTRITVDGMTSQNIGGAYYPYTGSVGYFRFRIIDQDGVLTQFCDFEMPTAALTLSTKIKGCVNIITDSNASYNSFVASNCN